MNNNKKKLKPRPEGKRNKYTEQQRIDVLLLLRENSYNYRKTELETGVPYATIKGWYEKYKNQLNEMTSISCIAEKAELNIARIKTTFIQKHYDKMSDLAEKAISKAVDLIKSEEDLAKVNGTIKVITDCLAKLSEINPDEKRTSGDTINIIHQTIANLNCVKEE